MFNLLKPNLYVARLENIPLEQLTQKGIRGLIIDLDNTITEWNSFEIQDKVMDWFKLLPKYGLQPCLVSNNNRGRVKRVADLLEVPFIHKAGKPRRKAFRKGVEALNLKPEEVAVIGDQVFTDVLGGNRSELLTILVVPLSTREFIGTRFMRRLEKLVLAHIIKQEPER
ncbi:MAG: YqeG family HAD IIIA-type phosphatase [Clostridia bacterium]|jgi:HAD superfamily phosphatase (TIGR01668 family)|nr:YqeG family HAD IIIA-type phosphatase [Clostridia bacterium]